MIWTTQLALFLLTVGAIVPTDHCKDAGHCFNKQSGDYASSQEDALRLILVGKTGAGKSNTGNLILGETKFRVSGLALSATKAGQMERGIINCTAVEVMDCPGLFDTSLSHADTAREIFRAVVSMAPGPHAFLYVIPVGRYTEEEFNTYKRLKRYFEGVNAHMIVVFTFVDRLKAENISQGAFVNKAPANLKTVLNECGNRYFFIHNDPSNRAQINQLMSVIDSLGGSFYNHKLSAQMEKEFMTIVDEATTWKRAYRKAPHRLLTMTPPNTGHLKRGKKRPLVFMTQ